MNEVYIKAHGYNLISNLEDIRNREPILHDPETKLKCRFFQVTWVIEGPYPDFERETHYYIAFIIPKINNKDFSLVFIEVDKEDLILNLQRDYIPRDRTLNNKVVLTITTNKEQSSFSDFVKALSTELEEGLDELLCLADLEVSTKIKVDKDPAVHRRGIGYYFAKFVLFASKNTNLFDLQALNGWDLTTHYSSDNIIGRAAEIVSRYQYYIEFYRKNYVHQMFDKRTGSLAKEPDSRRDIFVVAFNENTRKGEKLGLICSSLIKLYNKNQPNKIEMVFSGDQYIEKPRDFSFKPEPSLLLTISRLFAELDGLFLKGDVESRLLNMSVELIQRAKEISKNRYYKGEEVRKSIERGQKIKSICKNLLSSGAGVNPVRVKRGFYNRLGSEFTPTFLGNLLLDVEPIFFVNEYRSYPYTKDTLLELTELLQLEINYLKLIYLSNFLDFE